MSTEKWKTRREKIIDDMVLNKYSLDLKDLMRYYEYQSKGELINDIRSIERTLRQNNKKLQISPIRCISCEYIFKNKDKEFKIPSKCPKCKSERIEWPSIRVK